MSSPSNPPVQPTAAPKPRDTEIDAFGMTHVGNVRKANQDHFLLCSLHRQVVLHGTSLPDLADIPLRGERLAILAMVAERPIHFARRCRCCRSTLTGQAESCLWHSVNGSNRRKMS